MSTLELSKTEYLKLIREMVLYQLIIPDYLVADIDNKKWRKCWNGAGADNTPHCFRWFFTRMLSEIPCTILLHDIEHTTRRKSSYMANYAFEENGKKEINGRIKTWIMKKYAFTKFKLAVWAIDNFGEKWEIYDM